MLIEVVFVKNPNIVLICPIAVRDKFVKTTFVDKDVMRMMKDVREPLSTSTAGFLQHKHVRDYAKAMVNADISYSENQPIPENACCTQESKLNLFNGITKDEYSDQKHVQGVIRYYKTTMQRVMARIIIG